MKQSSKPILITLVGNIASGKTTAMPYLKDEFNASLLYADDLFQTKNPFAKDFLGNTSRWAFTNELWMTIERIKLLRNHLKNCDSELSIIDSGLLMSWVYTYSHYIVKIISKHEWRLYDSIFSEFVKKLFIQSNVIFLSYSVDTLMKRINKRGRDYELNYYTRTYLKQIDQGLEALKIKMEKANVRTLTIKETRIRDFENNPKDRKALLRLIRNFIFV